MYRRILLTAILIFALANVYAEEPRTPRDVVNQGLRGRSLTMDISARIVEDGNVVVWSENHERITISGGPVSLKLVGSNVVVVVQFTPFIRPRGESVLVAQGQVWIEVPNEGIRFHTSIQTIPLTFNEPIVFFPLGTAQQGSTAFENNAYIEIVVTTRPYGGMEGTPAFVIREGQGRGR